MMNNGQWIMYNAARILDERSQVLHYPLFITHCPLLGQNGFLPISFLSTSLINTGSVK